MPWVFGRRPWLGLVILIVLYMFQVLAGYIPNPTIRAGVATAFTLVIVLLVGIPFIGLLLSPRVHIYRSYLVYTLFALQLAFASLTWTIDAWDPDAYTGLCPTGCTTPWVLGLRSLYFSAGTFTLVGYGDVVPVSWVATLFALPLFWAPLFFLAFIISKR